MRLRKSIREIQQEIKNRNLDVSLTFNNEAETIVFNIGAFSELYIIANFNGDILKFEYDVITNAVLKYSSDYVIKNWIEL